MVSYNETLKKFSDCTDGHFCDAKLINCYIKIIINNVICIYCILSILLCMISHLTIKQIINAVDIRSCSNYHLILY